MSICRSLTLLLIALFSLLSLPATAQEDDPGKALLINLAEAPASKVEEAVNAIVSSGDERARGWLEAYGNNRLSRVKDTGQVVLVLNNRGRDWEIADPLTGENMGEMSRRELDRVAINNRIRGQLEGILAMLDLNAKDPDVREASAQDMMGKVDASLVEPLEAQLAKEEDAAVRNRIEEALAIYRVGEGNLEAVDVLAGSLHPRARAALNEAVRGDNEALAQRAAKALESIEQKLQLNRAAETLYFGLSLGSVLVLAAIGLAITFGVMGVINMAHGELIMLGAYTTWGMQQLFPGQPGLALILSIPAGFMVAATAGIIIERSVIQYLKGRPLETLLATFGISLILQQLVRTVI